ncbi:MAG: molybdenum cofactor biosynthesis protein MoaE [Spiribacter salinus]|uniref:Molybdopterin synthase catalytic subunit n=1 Tax=Spiribacter salinus TaxID=1335746 RepID=A0A540VRT0_9GAMM|nr:molybdenum cofactor biosynthesis protein MoaE [Spiribacter sp.]TQE98873.1 MAG: molybdenum cofactor biosynthesis protein MoaE [Spiribacter salinus]
MSERVDSAAIEIDRLLEETDSPDAGAVVVFGGTVRRHHDGKAVTAIEYSAYEPLAEKALAEVEAEAMARFDILSCAIRHRTGKLEVGELSVVVVVRSAHRAEAFEAGRFAIDTLKKTAPVWKREAYGDGTEVYLQGETLPGAGE